MLTNDHYLYLNSLGFASEGYNEYDNSVGENSKLFNIMISKYFYIKIII